MAIFNSCVKLPEGSLGTDSCAMTLLNRCWTRLRWERTQVVDDLPADMSSFQAAVASDHRKIRKFPWSLVDVHGFSRFFSCNFWDDASMDLSFFSFASLNLERCWFVASVTLQNNTWWKIIPVVTGVFFRNFPKLKCSSVTLW